MIIWLPADPAALRGMLQSLDPHSQYMEPEGFKDIAAYVVVLVMLVVKPNGLFGGAMRKKV